MQRVKKIHIFIVVSVILCICLLFFMHNSSKIRITRAQRYRVLLKASKKLNDIWKNASIKYPIEQKNCQDILPSLESVGSHYLKCNPLFLLCYFRNKDIEINHKGDNYKVSVIFGGSSSHKSRYKIVTKNNTSGKHLPLYGLSVKLNLRGAYNISLPIILKNSCNEIKLKRGIYAYGVFDPKVYDWNWDNLGRNIIIDRFKVSNQDIIDWLEFSDYLFKDKVIHSKALEDYPKEATKLTLKQMKDYCSFRGKQLLTAQVFDAMAFHPGDYTSGSIFTKVRSGYPWTKNRDTFHTMAISGKIMHKIDHCKYIYSKECLKLTAYKSYSTDSVSWAGVFQILGGSMEAVRNPLEPNKNLIPSSYHIELLSYWHQIGLRVNWNGEDRDLKSIDWLGGFSYEENSYDIGFRCMRYEESV